MTDVQLDPFDLAKLQEVYREHMEIHEVEHDIDLDRDDHSNLWNDTLLRLDQVCEELGVEYGDDVESLQGLLQEQEIDGGIDR